MQFKTRATKRPSIEITPMIDVVFLLLIFFMISSTFVSNPGIRINLPKAAVKGKPIKIKQIEVTVVESGKIYVNGKRTPGKKLLETLKKLAPSAGGKTVLIRADGKAFHQEVVFVMETAKKAGLHRLLIATRPRKNRS